jgi:hypothetical protein
VEVLEREEEEQMGVSRKETLAERLCPARIRAARTDCPGFGSVESRAPEEWFFLWLSGGLLLCPLSPTRRDISPQPEVISPRVANNSRFRSSLEFV